MGETTGIAWTHHTFNPWVGCAKVSAECTHCYAETENVRYGHAERWGLVSQGAQRVRTSVQNWKLPLRWEKAAVAAGERRRVFCASWADVFDAEVPSAWREDLATLISATPHLDWLLLTKRPENILKFWPGAFTEWPNVWFGTSVGVRDTLHRIETLRAVPAAVRFVSAEPLLEDITPLDLSGIDWVIIGGESGPKARPMDLAWARSLMKTARDQGARPFVKQLGRITVDEGQMRAASSEDLKQGDPLGWPADLRVREWPEARP